MAPEVRPFPSGQVPDLDLAPVHQRPQRHPAVSSRGTIYHARRRSPSFLIHPEDLAAAAAAARPWARQARAAPGTWRRRG
jgi:hypothetical protein